jgi:ribonuclease HI
VIIYTDGAAVGSHGPAGIGVVIYRDGGPQEVSRYIGHARSTEAELVAIDRALELSRDLPHVVIRTDFLPAIEMITKSRSKKLRHYLDPIRRKMQGRRVDFEFVRSHSGDRGNEKADELACRAVAEHRSVTYKRRKSYEMSAK